MKPVQLTSFWEVQLWTQCMAAMVNEHCVNDALLRCDAAVTELRMRMEEWPTCDSPEET